MARWWWLIATAVFALVATAFLSFGLWVHHMFATGLPQISLAFFSAASEAVVIPTGVQIFVFIATLMTIVVIFGAVMYVVEGPRHGFTSIPTAMYWAVVTVGRCCRQDRHGRRRLLRRPRSGQR